MTRRSIETSTSTTSTRSSAFPPGIDARVGDWIAFGISHPCTAFDKWHLLPVVDGNDHVVDLVRTYF